MKSLGPVVSTTQPYNGVKKTLKYCDKYHSTYVPPKPSGARGLFMYLESPLMLLLMGSFAAIVALGVDIIMVKSVEIRTQLAQASMLYFFCFTCLTSTMGCLLVHFCCPQAAGSGLPEIKVAIGGAVIKEYLSWECLVTKILGLIAAYSAGLSIGKEGPLIMITCAFTNIVLHLGIFDRLRRDASKRLEMFGCACAAAVAATFGTPFGGVLFSVEVTCTFYMVHNLPRAFFAAITGAVVVALMGQHGRDRLFDAMQLQGIFFEDSKKRELTLLDMIICTWMGVLSGYLAAFFTYMVSKLVHLREQFFATTPSRLVSKKLALVLLVTLLANVLEYVANTYWLPQQGRPTMLLDVLFARASSPGEENISRPLLFYLPLKIAVTAFSVVLPLPCGIFYPSFVIGAMVGRLLGEILLVLAPLQTTTLLPFEFAVIGAAAFSSGVTRAISTAIIIMEISSDDYMNIPVSLAILGAYFTGGRFIENIYDVLATSNKLPRLKKLPKAAYEVPSSQVMTIMSPLVMLNLHSTIQDAMELLERSQEYSFPVVNNEQDMYLSGVVVRHELAKTIEIATSFYEKRRNPQDFNNWRDDLRRERIKFLVLRLGIYCDELTFEAADINDVCGVVMNPTPFQVPQDVTMQKIDFLFKMLKLSNVYVSSRDGQLVGAISRVTFMAFLEKARQTKRPGVARILCDWIVDLANKMVVKTTTSRTTTTTTTIALNRNPTGTFPSTRSRPSRSEYETIP